MTAEFWIALFLALGVLMEWLCCLGLLAARTPLDKLHFMGPASSAGPLLIGIAVLISEWSSGTTVIKLVLIILVLAVTGPVLTHATGRAIYMRHRNSGEEASE